MDKVQVLPLHDVRRIVGSSSKRNKKIVWRTSEFSIKPLLTLEEYVDVVKRIIGMCSSPDGSIVLGLVDFSIRANIIGAYGFVELPNDMEELYYIVYASDLYEKICSMANSKQIDSIINSVNLYVNHSRGDENGNV